MDHRRTDLSAYHAAFHGWGNMHAVSYLRPRIVRDDDRQAQRFLEELTAFEILDQDCQQTGKIGDRRSR
jgi:hypothetical protein